MPSPDPTTEDGWRALANAVNRRMRRALAKIDHDRRAELIDRVIGGRATPEEEAELDALQRACDEAMVEQGDMLAWYRLWQARQIGGDGLVALLEREANR